MLAAMALLAAVAAPVASAEDRQNIAVSTAIAQRVGDRLWPNWSKTPFAIDLQTAGGPVAINFTRPLAPPSFPADFEATFPLSNGVPTIVIGEPQFAQANTPIRWDVTLLHEHFHQWQFGWPQYRSAVAALGLAAPGDTNANWMLNYPFPYQDAHTNALYVTAARSLATAVQAIGFRTFRDAARSYLAARAQFKAALKSEDYKYFAFQCWQEGTARYTEIMVARMAAAAHRRDPSFLTGAQATVFSADAAATYRRTLRRLSLLSLMNDERVNFYAFGAGEALLLDQLAPGWRARYLSPGLDLGAYFPSV